MLLRISTVQKPGSVQPIGNKNEKLQQKASSTSHDGRSGCSCFLSFRGADWGGTFKNE